MYESQGLSSVIIHIGEQVDYAFDLMASPEVNFAMPMLLDADELILTHAVKLEPGNNLFPLSYLIAPDGSIYTSYNTEDEGSGTYHPPGLFDDLDDLVAD